MRDRTPTTEFPRRASTVLLFGAAAYAVYRMLQTVLYGATYSDPGVSALDRIVVSAADGTLMALTVPLALWASRRFPLGSSARGRNIAAHMGIALTAAALWIVALSGVYAAVTHTPLKSPLAPAYLAWLTTNLFAYSLLVAVVHLISFQERVRQTELKSALLQSQLSTAKLETLRAQLQPHFLFNTLHTISELIHIDPNAADAMVIRLGRLLRVSLEYTADTEVSIDREMEIVGAYLDLHRMRHGDRLSSTIDVEPSVRNALVPPMILQPLVENSLRHGLNRRAAGGRIWVSARRHGNRLRLTVSDDGVGLPGTIVEGVGLSNTRTRLHQLYDTDQTFRLGARGEGGTEATIEIPLHVAESDRRLARSARGSSPSVL
jgi:two-component system LytT family sensor kinase